MTRHRCQRRQSFGVWRADSDQRHCLANLGCAQVIHLTDQKNQGLEISGLEKSPFSSGLETRLFFEGASHREALARLRFLRTNRRLGVVFGEPGTGKSLLLRVFEDECRRQGCQIASVNLLGLSTREFYWQIASQLAATVRLEDDQFRLFRQLSDRVAVNQLQGVPTVLLVDDAHQAGPDLLAQLARLTQLDAASPSPLTMVLATRESHSGRLGEHLLELVDLRIDLEPWDELDTTGYLQLAQVEMGCQQPLFDDGALSEIHRLSAGIPRCVNRLADYALLVGASGDSGIGDSGIINAETIRTAHEALSPPVRA
jgi:general secretion pathway protein A